MVKLVVSIVTLFLISLSVQAQTGSVLFKVSGIQADKGGSISTGIFTKENFPEVGKQFRGKDVTVNQSNMEVLLENVPVGTYAAVVFQDQNNNKKLETNFVGFPKEPIGFANDARIKFGPPDFEDAAITVTEGQTVIVNIQLR